MKKELTLLRQKMQAEHVDVLLVPMDDFHQSEHVSEYFKTIEYVTGFTGDSCNLVVTQTESRLFTDGRYFIQAEQELRNSGTTLMKMGEKGVPSLTEYIRSVLPADGSLGFDGRCVDFRLGSELSSIAMEKNAALIWDADLVGEIWENRPALPESRVWILEERWAGKSAAEKLAELRADMENAGAEVHVIASLDDIAWLLNLRGNDVLCTPVFLSYFLVTQQQTFLFANEASFDTEVRDYLQALDVQLLPYNNIYEAVKQLRSQTILLETGKTNYALITALDGSMKLVDRLLPSSYRKAIKNPVEIENEREAHIRDGIAITKYCYFLKHAYDANGVLTDWARERLQSEALTEITASDYLERLRREQDGFVELSFPTISAYGKNAALPHYSPSREHDVVIEPHGLYLVDSGGHYLMGTTDITRTLAMGEITETERHHFTRVCQAMLRLGDVQILHGAIGVSFDYAARELFWREGLNFNHGTGHGVGYLLNVHERPNGIRYRIVPERLDSGTFEPGHITSDEPGIYIEGSHGIRTENMTVCKKAFENEFGEFLNFEFLTMCPIDLDALDPSIMERHDIELLNRYHATVFEKLSPYFEGDELQWLKEATREV